ncbi:mitochondrial substrate carrier family protein [Tieghemostelium lacteum]|uniref:Mitochondrial substrate carrier family protein n=1 Tax=Tieghemostelium lacteum TaxID=361077 RepID=A0A151ZCK5_TIELA|nr:mitochondrial substrate carrier family protein [Tieghemostelium lacteum]|eukprot:KYQ91678.1 mitochondrial substrate carrier family protein [Tieghemostelium lacteum]
MNSDVTQKHVEKSPNPTTPGHNGYKQIQWDDLDPKKYYFYNFILSGCIDVSMYPLDIIRTRLQVQGSSNIAQSFHHYNGTFDGFKKLYKYEGLKGYYKGFFTSELGYLSSRAIYFGTYEVVKQSLQRWSNKPDKSDLLYITSLSGATAEICASCIWVPFDLVTQTLQIQGKLTEPKYKNGPHVFHSIYKERSIRGLYRGFGATMIRNVPYSGIWWGTYELSKEKLHKCNIREYLNLKQRKDQFLNVHVDDGYKVHNEDPLVHFISGFTAAVIATTLTNPLDVAKTRLQTGVFESMKNTNFYTVIRDTIKKEGVRALWKGLVPSLLTSAPYSMISIFLYEEVKKLSLK